jgi:hypothetical protein
MSAHATRSLQGLAAALVLLTCAHAHAQGGVDLMKTPECAAARQQFDPLLAAGGPHDRLVAARRRTALACFGVALPQPVPAPANRVQPPPVTAEPIRLRSTPSLSAAKTSQVAPAPAATAPVITACDAAGCWDSRGAYYSQDGPLLLGPRGPCTREAGSLNCP